MAKFDRKSEQNRTIELTSEKRPRKKQKKKRSLILWQSRTIRRVVEADKKKGGFSGIAGRISNLPCHEIGEITTFFLEERGIGGPARRNCCMLVDCDKLTF